MHIEAVQCCIDNGVHVFVEKPFSLGPQYSESIIKNMNGSKLVNQVGYVCRFNDVFIQVKKLLEQKVLGELLIFKMEMNGPTLLKDAKRLEIKKSEGAVAYTTFPHIVLI